MADDRQTGCSVAVDIFYETGKKKILNCRKKSIIDKNGDAG
jgi:hypothetical protein